MNKRNPIVGREIAFKLRMKKRWETDREGMLRRSRAGARAMIDKAARNREAWALWLSRKACFMTKQQLIESVSKCMERPDRTKPYSVFLRLIRYGLISFDVERMEYRNLCFKV